MSSTEGSPSKAILYAFVANMGIASAKFAASAAGLLYTSDL